MDKYCTNCGNELPEDANACPKCGKFIYKKESQEEFKARSNVSKVKVPGSGMSTAGMVLGIIAGAWALLQILSIWNIKPTLMEALDGYENLLNTTSILLWFSVGYTLFSLIPSLVGLPLSIAGLLKYKSGKNIAGIVLNIFAFGISVFAIIYIMSFA